MSPNSTCFYKWTLVGCTQCLIKAYLLQVKKKLNDMFEL